MGCTLSTSLPVTSHPPTVTSHPPTTRKRKKENTKKKSSSAVNPNVIDRDYIFLETLGKGHFASVKLAKHKKTGLEVAIKVIAKSHLEKQRDVVESEIAVLRKVGSHPNVVHLLDSYENDTEFFLVMEYCKGGDLFSKITELGNYSEAYAAQACKQLATALHFIHQQGITHRDLKPENILLVEDSITSDIKVADFGLAKLLPSERSNMRTICGTWAYCAPEVISRQLYTQKVDIWTLGVLQFILLAGYHPFDVYGDLPEPELLIGISSVKYDFDDEIWEEVSKEAKDLIGKMLQLDPEKRIGLKEYLSHPWVAGKEKPGDVSLYCESIKHRNHVIENLGSRFKTKRDNFGVALTTNLAKKKFKNLTVKIRTQKAKQNEMH